MAIHFDTSSWTALQPAFDEHIKSQDPDVANEAAMALRRLLLQGSARHLTDLPPESTAHALLGALRRHPEHQFVQGNGCGALRSLYLKFPELCTALQRDPSVYATVRAAAKADPVLEKQDFYKALCVSLQPPQPEDKGQHQSGYAGAKPGASSAHQSGAADAEQNLKKAIALKDVHTLEVAIAKAEANGVGPATLYSAQKELYELQKAEQKVGTGPDGRMEIPSSGCSAEQPGATGASPTHQSDAKAEQNLQKAMALKDIHAIEVAIETAEANEVENASLLKAYKVLKELQKAERMKPASPEAMQDGSPCRTVKNLLNLEDDSCPMGIKICKAVDKIYEHLKNPEAVADGDVELEACCREAHRKSADPLLKQSIFGVMQPSDIKHFLEAGDHKMWLYIKAKTEEFLELLEKPGRRPRKVELEELHEDGDPELVRIAKVLRQTRPVVMDHTVREPATTTPFGHTGYMKYLSLKIIQKMGLNSIAISGQYYGSSYTPETQILEWIRLKNEPMDGMIVMFGPGKEDRKAGIQCIKDFQVPNAFLDLTMKSSARFQQADFVKSVIEAVEELDKIFTEMGFPEEPWRDDKVVNTTFAKGEISLNLVDLMEFSDLKIGGHLDPKKKEDAEKAFHKWKECPAFRRRVVAILTEESRGVATNMDYGRVVKWLREHFPAEEKYRVLVHAHAGDGNSQDVASVDAVSNGANGVWSAIIPQAAQAGHNSSLVFLDNLLKVGNPHVCTDYKIHRAAQCARHVYSLNFNTYDFPHDCPVWGGRARQQVHSAFSTVDGETWRKKREDYFNVWGTEALGQMEAAMKQGLKMEKDIASGDRSGRYRIAPLVSDIRTWVDRIDEALPDEALGNDECPDDYAKPVRDLGFALMNAGIRVNLNEANTLKKLVEIVKRDNPDVHEKAPCQIVAKCLKAEQHQGAGE